MNLFPIESEELLEKKAEQRMAQVPPTHPKPNSTNPDRNLTLTLTRLTLTLTLNPNPKP